MAYRITNNSKAPRGVHSVSGRLVFVEPGETKVVDLVNSELDQQPGFLEIVPDGDFPDPPPALERAVKDALDHDGDGKKGGSAKGAQSTRAKGAAKRKATGRPKAAK